MRFSTPEQMRLLGSILSRYALLPFRPATPTGSLVENIFAHIRGGEVMNTYDFVDVIEPADGCGWQVKSTKSSTPITWKRAKLPDSALLIQQSVDSTEATQDLGRSIIENCNSHAIASLDKFDLEEIGYSRLILKPDGMATYFERSLCSQSHPILFQPDDYHWEWSQPKRTITKEQLPALHGIERRTGKKSWAWHGRGENQLHFYGESHWWPEESDLRSFSFQMPTAGDVLSVDQFLDLLAQLDG